MKSWIFAVAVGMLAACGPEGVDVEGGDTSPVVDAGPVEAEALSVDLSLDEDGRICDRMFIAFCEMSQCRPVGYPGRDASAAACLTRMRPIAQCDRAPHPIEEDMAKCMRQLDEICFDGLPAACVSAYFHDQDWLCRLTRFDPESCESDDDESEDD